MGPYIGVNSPQYDFSADTGISASDFSGGDDPDYVYYNEYVAVLYILF